MTSPNGAPRPSIHSKTVELLDEAIATLQQRPDDEAIHATRRASKRIRAALRLMRPSLGREVCRRENRRVRDAARPLTAVRDAFVLLRTLKSLAVRPAALKRALQADYRKQRESTGWQRSAVKLCLTRDVLRAHPGSTDERAAAISAVRKSYKRSRAALDEAQPLEEHVLHEWRKQTKYLLYELELVDGLFGLKATKLSQRAAKLAEILGDDHDLAVLAVVASRWNSLTAPLQRQIDKRRRRLQRQALRLGERLFRQTPRRIERKLERRLP